MTTAGQALRRAIETCHHAHAVARVHRWRDPTDDARPRTAEIVAWLAGEGGQEALAEALGTGEVDAEAHRWLGRHVDWLVVRSRADDHARWAREDLAEAALPGGTPLHLADELGAVACSDDPVHRDETGRALTSAVARAAHRLVDGALEAERAAAPPPRLDFGGLAPELETTPAEEETDDTRIEQARLDAMRAFLVETEDAAQDAVEWQVRGLGAGRPVPWHALLRGLRATHLDAPTQTKVRFHRVAAVWRRLGFERDMSATMRAERDHGGVLPFTTLACVSAPRDIRVAQLPRDWGVLSDVCAAQGVAHALGHGLALPTHPPELRWLLPGSVAGAFGGVAFQLWAERTQLVRLQGLSGPEAERVARVAGAFALLVVRAWAALATAPVVEAPGRARRMELWATALGEALRCDVPPSVASLVAADTARVRACAVEHLGGLALAVGLRERHDEDWFLDPRLEERFRGAGQRGNALSIESFCEELRVDLGAASRRAIELVT